MGFLRAVALAFALHAVLIPLERIVPSIREHNLDPFLRTIPPLLAGYLWATWSPQPTAWRAGLKGSLVGGLSGLLGSGLTAILGGAHPSLMVVAVSVTGTSIVLGAGGAVAGWWAGRQTARS